MALPPPMRTATHGPFEPGCVSARPSGSRYVNTDNETRWKGNDADAY